MSYLFDYRQRKLAELVASKPSVLDLGFGAIPNKYYKNQRVCGLDLEAQETPENYAEVKSGNVMDLPSPYQPESFDSIVAGELIEHLECPVDFLRGCYQTLKKGGLLVISTPNPHSVYEQLLTLTMSRSYFFDPEHVFLIPQRWLLRVAEIAGFHSTQVISGGICLPYFDCTLPFPRPWAEYSILIAQK